MVISWCFIVCFYNSSIFLKIDLEERSLRLSPVAFDPAQNSIFSTNVELFFSIDLLVHMFYCVVWDPYRWNWACSCNRYAVIFEFLCWSFEKIAHEIPSFWDVCEAWELSSDIFYLQPPKTWNEWKWRWKRFEMREIEELNFDHFCESNLLCLSTHKKYFDVVVETQIVSRLSRVNFRRTKSKRSSFNSCLGTIQINFSAYASQRKSF